MKSPSGVSQRSRRQAMRGAGASAATMVCRWPPGSHQGALYFPGRLSMQDFGRRRIDGAASAAGSPGAGEAWCTIMRQPEGVRR